MRACPRSAALLHPHCRRHRRRRCRVARAPTDARARSRRACSRADLKLPHATQGLSTVPDDCSKTSEKIKELLGEEKDFYVVVQSACGIEMVMDTKVMTESAK